MTKGREQPRDSWPIRILRSFRHPLRALTLAIAAYCLVGDIALETGVIAAISGAILGVPIGERVASSRYRSSWIAGLLGGFALFAWLMAWAAVRAPFVVDGLGTSGALHLSSLLQYGGIALGGSTMLRVLAKRHPSWLALEVGIIVVAVAVALAAHRHGVIARPLWLSDLAWRQGIDPANVLLAVGIGAALASVSLLVFERKGKLSLAAIPLVPLVAILAVSCLDIARQQSEMGETSPDPTDEEGEQGQTDEQGDFEHGGGDGEGDHGDAGRGQAEDRDDTDAGGGSQQSGDGGAGRGGGLDGGGGGGSGLDGGAGGGEGFDGGAGGGEGDLSGDGGTGGGQGDRESDGGGGGGGGGGESDGGGGSGAGDGGSSGGASGDGGPSGGGDGGTEPRPAEGDAGTGGGAPDSGAEQRPGQGGQGESSDQPPPNQPTNPSDLNDRPPPSTGASSMPVAVVLFENDYTSPSGGYYFRQEAWSEFHGHRLVPTTLEGADTDLIAEFPLSGRATSPTPPGEAGRAGVVTRIALLIEHPKPFGLESLEWVEDIRNPNRARFRRAYRAFSRAQKGEYSDLVGHAAGNPEWSDEVRALYLAHHPDPRFAEFADEVVAGIPEEQRDDPFTRAVAIKLRLDSMLTYSTRERHADAEDPTVDFFFGNRIGYCVHFAHTAVFLYRAAGVPARIGSGYMAAETRRGGGSALVLQGGDAHAWPEIYLDGVGWIVLDIAANEILDTPPPPPDQDMQDLLADMAREEPPDPMEETHEAAWQWPPLWPILYWTLTTMLTLSLLGLYATKFWRRHAWRFMPSSKLPWLAHRSLLDRLSEAGITREEGETREQFARRIADRVPSFQHATSRVLSASLANSDPRSGAPEYRRAEWSALVGAVSRELGTSTKLWRRVLGWLNPLSFWDVR